MSYINLKRAAVALCSILPCSFCCTSTGSATGFLIYNQHAAANASAVAYTAQVDNPSAVFYNPAAINQLSGTQTSGGGVALIPRTKFKSAATGTTTHMKDHTYLLPTVYLTHKINERFSLGIGSFSHFGLSTDWPDDWEGNFISTFAELRTFFINPVISCQVNDALSLAVGFSPVYSDLRFKKALKIRQLPLNFGNADLDGDGIGYGFNLALLYRMSERIKAGLSYRSAIDIDYEGDADFNANPLIQFLLPEGSVDLDIELPPILAGGIAATITEKLTIECDLIWVGFSTYDELHADFKQRVRPLLRNQFAPIPRDYKDVLDYAISAYYQLNTTLTLRCGFLFDRSAVPEENADPILPDSDKYIVGAGFSVKKAQWDLHVSYYGVFSSNLTVRRNYTDFNGTYESFASLISLSFDYRF
jgi:long-chain fatty acid transport protein